jgi:Glycosyltransferase family 10 (fucosyltransferase) C-term
MVVKVNPFQSRNQFFISRRRLTSGSAAGSAKQRRRRWPLRDSGGLTSANARFRRLIRRALWLFVTVALGVILVSSNYELILLFLKGPTVVRKSSTNFSRVDDAYDREPYLPPDVPRPPREHVYTIRTEKERQLDTTLKKNFEEMRESGKLVPCRLDGDCWETVSQGFLPFRSTVQPRIWLRNPLEEDRYWCGKRIWGRGGVLDVTETPEKCKYDALSYIYSKGPPTLSGKSTPPVELFWNFNAWYEANMVRSETFPCSTPCRSNGDFAVLSTINVKDTKWEITHTMEGEKYYSAAHVGSGSYRENRFYSTTSFKSEIPAPYFSWAEYKIMNPAVDFDKAIKGASFLAGNCYSHSNREEVVAALMETSLRVDSLSSCMHNAEPPHGINMNNKTDVMQAYLFHLAFENQKSEDYITEKLWGALESGTLPVYLGAPNIKEHVPANSIILLDDFESPRDLAEYLVRLTKDKTLYESYHRWRYQPIDPVFASKYEFTNTHSTCRMCKWAFAKRHGLGWNHSKQEVVEPFIAHKTCRNSMGLVGYPFKEYWLSPGDGQAERVVEVTSTDSTKTCTLTDSNRVVEIDGGNLSRKIYDHDGVTDLFLTMKGTGNYVLKLECPITATKLYEANDGNNNMIRWWQDTQSRMTVLASDNVTVSVSERGMLRIAITSHPTRIRVIVEDVDHYHKGTRKILSYFGELMSRDFFSPIEAYKVV